MQIPIFTAVETADDTKEIFRQTKRRTPRIQKSLAIILMSLLGHQVVIELKNDIEVTGIIEVAESNMNMTLVQARQVFPNGDVVEMDVAFVQGAMVRYVHIPKEIPVIKHTDAYMKTVERVSKASGPHKIVTNRKRKSDSEVPTIS